MVGFRSVIVSALFGPGLCRLVGILIGGVWVNDRDFCVDFGEGFGAGEGTLRCVGSDKSGRLEFELRRFRPKIAYRKYEFHRDPLYQPVAEMPGTVKTAWSILRPF